MLQLLKLEAYGFKSFADKLHIEFGRGITAIVGPNGSGKSNITDAIRWVLGEQNIRNLRGIKAEDIIFSGSSQRRRLGVAEVSLVLDNKDGDLPLDFQEVTVTRRIFRSGESEYYINKTPCRLKDIYALFADTGLGRDAMSVISQNKVDYVLNCKAEERRELFEEVAGITKFRNRKREALRKLGETEKNQLRVGDIINEIEQNIGKLADSAEKTKRYNALQRRYEQAKITLLLNKHDQYDLLLKTARREQKGLNDQLAAHRAAVNHADVTRIRLHDELQEVEKAMQLLVVKNRQFSSELEKNSGRLAVLEERLRQSELDKARLTAFLVETASKEQQAQKRLTDNAQQTSAMEARFARVQAKLSAVTGELQKLDNKLAFAKKSLQKSQAEQVSQLKNTMQLEAAVEARRTDVRIQESAVAEHMLLKASLEQEIADCKKTCDDLKEKCTAVEMRLTEQARQQQSLQKDLMTAQAARDKDVRLLERQQQEIAAAVHKIQFLQSLQAEYEGFGKAVKAVLKAPDSWNKGICGVVAALIKVPADYITAVEIALGGALQNIVTIDDVTAKLAIGYLKKNRLGRATFLPLDTIQNSARPILPERLRQQRGCIGYAADLVEYAPQYRKIVAFVFRQTIVMRTLEDAMALARAENYKLRLVTLDGQLINPGGSFTGGSNVRREASFFNRSEEMLHLSDQLQFLRKAVADLEKSKVRHFAKCHRLSDELAEAQVCYNQIEVAAAEERMRASQAQQALENKRQALNRQKEKIADLEDNLQASQSGLYQAEKTFAATKDNTADERAAKLEGFLSRYQTQRGDIYARQTDLKINLSALEQEMVYLQEKQRSEQQTLKEYHRQKQKAEAELKEGGDRQREYEQSTAALSAENQRLSDLKAIGERDYGNFQTIRFDKLNEMQHLDEELQQRRRNVNEIESRLHQQELEITKYTVMTEQCIAELSTEYKMSIDEARASHQGGDDELLLQESLALEQEIASLGSINPNAIAEYASANERYQFLKTQAGDLTKSRQYLTGIIASIDATMAKRFRAAFLDIKAYFHAIFMKLFGGGTAELKLTGGADILEAGIEIIVQPPGKRMNGLAVLSGGERALTVISLLFAFLQYKPAPFTVVDEIDAPLDEANIERFGKFLREYAENTQFIIVTHRKGTMQVADALYGVTASTAGVSRLLSVKLEDIEE